MFLARPRKPSRITSWIAILAMVLHALMPAVAQAHSGASARMVELCSALGIKKVTLSSEQTPVMPEKVAHTMVCPVCALAGAAVLPSPLTLFFFSALQAVAPPQPEYHSHPTPLCLPPASRGPPLAS